MSGSLFRKVLVANRGEIARRVLRTCRERGIPTVAVYSDVDRDSLHVSEAAEAVLIGEAPARRSYLDIDAVLEAARKTGADAIHPGYGFLSERPDFAAACEAAGLVFIGPPAAAMEVMGDKVRARRAMEAAGVPVVPGVDDVDSVERAIEAADQIGFPVMIKASAGGGGRGMRLVEDRAALPAAFEAAQREAEAAFGDPRLFIERAITHARHVEFQLLADRYGQVVHLGERDCSVQRRHQKVIEEAPCPSAQMTVEQRKLMGEVAKRAAASVGYVGAGTIEFLFEETPSGPRFYFLEMNTRLQVEHPVTEAVTGRDLVWDQLRVAAGQALELPQDKVLLRGHAFECRIYAEDPVSFLPRPGRVFRVRWPEGPGVRVDTAIADGSDVSSFYDPMIAKVTTWGVDRDTALRRMRRALDELVILGVETNLVLHRRIFAEPDFVAGALDTRYLEEHPALRELDAGIPPYRSASMAAAAAMHAMQTRSPSVTEAGTTESRSWRHAARWRS